MSPRTTSRNIAARMGRWSASHRKTAIFGWLAFVLAAIAIGTTVGQQTIDQHDSNVGQAHRADQILRHGGFAQSGPLTEIVVIQSNARTVADPAFRAVVGDVVHTVAPFNTVHHLRSPLAQMNRDQVSRDGHTALVEWGMSGTLKAAENQIDPLTSAVASVATAHPELYVGEAGAASSDKAINKLFNQQIGQAGERSVPSTLLILVLVFGSLLAAWVPLMLGLQSVVATIGLVDIVSHITPMDQNVGAVVMLVGLAVGVDYTRFYLRREREERAAGRGERAALEAAAATSGRSVLISGATVMIAMAGMLFSGDRTFTSLSIATMIVVAVAMIGSLTVLPALLSKLGDRVERGRIPLLGRLRRPAGEGRIWSKVLTPVLRRPAVSASIAAALLLAIAIPTLHMHTAQSGSTALPHSAPTVETLDRLQAAFPGQANPAVIAVKADTNAPVLRQAISGLQAAAASGGQGYGAISVDTNASHTVARVTIPLPGNGVDNTSTKALLTLRNQLLPATVRKVPGASYAVTGPTALVLFPAQQVLAVGTGALLEAVVVPLAFVLALSAISLVARVGGIAGRSVSMRRGTRSKRRLGRARASGELAMAAIVALSLGVGSSYVPRFGHSPPGTFTNIATPLAAVLVAVVAVRGQPIRNQRLPAGGLFAEFVSVRVALAAGGAAVLIAVTSALDGPTRLSRAVVYQSAGMCVMGPLVATNSEGVYLGDGVAHSIISVDARDVRSLVIRRAETDVLDSRGDHRPLPDRPLASGHAVVASQADVATVDGRHPSGRAARWTSADV